MENILYKERKITLIVCSRLQVALLCLILFTASIQQTFAALPQNQKITLNLQNVTLKEAFETIRKRLHFLFWDRRCRYPAKSQSANKQRIYQRCIKPGTERERPEIRDQEQAHYHQTGESTSTDSIIPPVGNDKRYRHRRKRGTDHWS